MTVLYLRRGINYVKYPVCNKFYLFWNCVASLGGFARLRKATTNFVISVRLFVRPHGTFRLPLDVFSWNLIFFEKEKLPRNPSFTKAGWELRLLYMQTDIHFWSYLALFFLEWKVFQTQVVAGIKRHILCSVTFFSPENRTLYELVKVKWSRYRSGVVQRVGRGIALLFHDRGTRRVWAVSRTTRPHFTPEKDRYPFYRRLNGPQGRSGRAKNLVPTGIRSRNAQPVTSSYTDWDTRPTVWDNMEKYFRVGQATDDNMVHAHCMLDNEGCAHPRNM